MQPLKLIFMGTPAFAVPTLQALIDSHHEVCAVYTQPPRPAHRGKKETPSPVHRLADEHDIPVFTPTSLKDETAQQAFAAHEADAAVVAAYGLLLPEPILTGCRFGCINVHPSRLPRWRGAAPIQRTVMAGDTDTAICIMQMNEGLDTGDVLLEKPYPVPPDMSAGALHGLLAQEAGPMVLETLEQLQTGTATPRAQADEGVTYAKKISKEEAKINWYRPAQEIHHLIRGLSPYPGAYTQADGIRIKILEATAEPVAHTQEPGTLLENQSLVACGEGAIRPTYVQRAGKNITSWQDFLNGLKHIPRTTFT